MGPFDIAWRMQTTPRTVASKAWRHQHPDQSRPEIGRRECELDHTDKATFAGLSKSKAKRDKAMSTGKTTNVNSGATAPISVDSSVLSMKEIWALARLERCVAKFWNQNEGAFHLQVCDGSGSIKLDGFLYVPEISHYLISVTALCDNGKTVQFTETSCVIKKHRNIVGVCWRTNEMDAVKPKNVLEQQSFASPEKDVRVLDVYRARLAHANHCSVKGIADNDAVRDMDSCQRSVLDDGSTCIKGQLTGAHALKDPCGRLACSGDPHW